MDAPDCGIGVTSRASNPHAPEVAGRQIELGFDPKPHAGLESNHDDPAQSRRRAGGEPPGCEARRRAGNDIRGGESQARTTSQKMRARRLTWSPNLHKIFENSRGTEFPSVFYSFETTGYKNSGTTNCQLGLGRSVIASP